MPTIISSAKLRNEYNAVSEQVHAHPEAVFVTRNGMGDMAVMSIETYDQLIRRVELADALALGHADFEAGRTQPARDVLAAIRKEL